MRSSCSCEWGGPLPASSFFHPSPPTHCRFFDPRSQETGNSAVETVNELAMFAAHQSHLFMHLHSLAKL
jgi:hypothetical protein